MLQPYFAFKEWDPSMPPLIQAELDYMAPEYILTMSNDTMSDMFSLGMLFQAVFNDGKTLFECREQINIYKQNVEEVWQMHIHNILYAEHQHNFTLCNTEFNTISV